MQPGSSVQKQAESGGESIHRTGFSREGKNSDDESVTNGLASSRLKPVLQDELLPKIWTVLLSGSRLGPVGHRTQSA